MGVFIYHVEEKGKLIKHEIKAKTLQLARLKLNAQQITPVFIKEKPMIPFLSGGQKKVSALQLNFFTRQLSFLIKSGVSLAQSIQLCINTSSSHEFKQTLKDILRRLEAGQSFSRCLNSHPHIFDGFYVNMVVCAEETGRLDEVLKDLGDYLEKAQKIKSRVKSAMMYPIIVLIISLLIITGIILFVVPQFAALYQGKGELPGLTQALVSLSDLLKNNLIYFIGTLIAIPLVLRYFAQTESGKVFFQKLIMNMPLFGKIKYQAAMVRFFRSFYSLLKSGVNFLQALDVSYNISEHPQIQKGIQLSRDYVTHGKSFSKGLKESKVFPSLVYEMAQIGEESGKIDQSFRNLTDYYENELDNLIAGLIKMIEPILLVVLGGIVGIMVLALYLPVFKMGDLVN
ncbi:MAG: type II secretion system F family protein [Bdellovibrionaceae bacterium]|nr:type II secretion system F family protein [Pseudobdellovibrionaceae bacterium]